MFRLVIKLLIVGLIAHAAFRIVPAVLGILPVPRRGAGSRDLRHDTIVLRAADRRPIRCSTRLPSSRRICTSRSIAKTSS